jgi:hypothetical protein
MIRRLIVRLLVAISIATTSILAGGAMPARAASGWIWHRDAWIKYSFQVRQADRLTGRALVVAFAARREAAIERAIRHRDGRLAELRRLLHRAQAVLNTGSAPFWYAVLRCEEGPGTPGWATHTASFVGGLGFRVETWRAYAPRAGVSAAIPAGPFPYSPAQQIAVANAVIAGNGGHYPPWPAADCSNWSGW